MFLLTYVLMKSWKQHHYTIFFFLNEYHYTTLVQLQAPHQLSINIQSFIQKWAQNCSKRQIQCHKKTKDHQLNMHTSFNVAFSWGLYNATSKYFNSSAMLNCSTGLPLNIILKFVNFLRYKMETYACSKDKN